MPAAAKREIVGRMGSLMNFFVYIVESPSAPDIYHGRSEGGLVAQALALDGIPCVSRTAITSAALTAAFRIGLPEVMKQFPDRLPIVHLSAHGGKEGIQLSDGQVVAWSELRDLLVPINVSLDGTLILCMSACEGFYGGIMAMEEGDAPHPYLALICHTGKPTWSDTAVSYLAFYHRLSKGGKLGEALKGMRAASGDEDWTIESAEEFRNGYLEYIRQKKVEPVAARQELEAVAEEEPVPPDAKALEGTAAG